MTRRSSRHAQAFTLIELLIAVTLGSLIVYTAAAGFSAASTAITRANHLSLDNSLLRAAYFQAQVHLDYWTDLDDPESDRPKDNPLRATRPVTGLANPRGLPFTPMDRVNPTWDPDWLPHDPRSWFRGNLVDGHPESTLVWADSTRGPTQVSENPIPPDSYPHLLFGRYALFTNVDSTPRNVTYRINTDPNPQPTAVDEQDQVIEVRYDAPVAHAGIREPMWYGQQVRGMIDSLGYYAFCEYLPPNIPYAWYASHDARTAPAGIPLRVLRDGYTAGLPAGAFFDRAESDRDGRAPVAHGLFRQTFSTAHGIFNPRAMPGELADNHYRAYAADRAAAAFDDRDRINARNQELQRLLTRTGHLEPIAERLPASWSRPHVAVGRFVKEGHFVKLARVQSQHPLTGQVIELSWAGLGTTLRGARMQRRSDGGWASWDNDGAGSAEPHLDSR